MEAVSSPAMVAELVLVVLEFFRTFGLAGTENVDRSLDCCALPLKTAKDGLLWSECTTGATAAATTEAEVGKLEGGETESVCKELDLSLVDTGIAGFVGTVLPCAARDPQEAAAGKTVAFPVVPLATAVLTEAANLTGGLLEEVEFELETSGSGGGRQLPPRLCDGFVRPWNC